MRVLDQTASTGHRGWLWALGGILVVTPLVSFPAWQIWIAVRDAGSPGGLSTDAAIAVIVGTVAGCFLAVFLMWRVNQAVANRRAAHYAKKFPGLPVIYSSRTSQFKYSLRTILRARGEGSVSIPMVFEVIVSENGFSFWSGFREIQQFYGLPWDDIQQIRVVRMTEGARRHPGIVFDLQVNNTQLSLPVKVERKESRLIGIGHSPMHDLAEQISALAPDGGGSTRDAGIIRDQFAG